MDWQTFSAVFFGIAAILYLLQCRALSRELDDLEFEQPEAPIEAQAQVEPAVAAGVLGCQVKPQGGQVAL